MKLAKLLLMCAVPAIVNAQGRSVDWPVYGGTSTTRTTDAQPDHARERGAACAARRETNSPRPGTATDRRMTARRATSPKL
jgi:hypothetical protein